MKRTFALILAGLLMLSVTACTSEPAESSSPPEESSSVSSQPEEGSSPTLEVVDGEKEEAEDENVSKLDTSSAPQQPTEPVESSQPGQSDNSQPAAEVTPPAEQQPAESKPEPKPEKETPVKVEQKPEPEAEPEPVQTPPAQTQQPPAPAASAQDDGAWTQEMVDDVVEAYRKAALDRGWSEDTSLNVDLTTGGAWGLPMDTRWTDYNVLMTPQNIIDELYLYEYDRQAEPEDMYFHVVSENHGDYWEIYFIFA